jgi:hypothetical protein
MNEEELERFMHESQLKIEKIIIDKMRYLGITVEDIKRDKDKYSPKKALIDETDVAILYEYSVIGITLIYVKYEPTGITTLNGLIDEPEYPHKDEWI